MHFSSHPFPKNGGNLKLYNRKQNRTYLTARLNKVSYTVKCCIYFAVIPLASSLSSSDLAVIRKLKVIIYNGAAYLQRSQKTFSTYFLQIIGDANILGKIILENIDDSVKTIK